MLIAVSTLPCFFYKGKSKMSLEPISSIPVEEAVAKEASLAPLAGRLAGVKFEPVSASGDSHVFTTEVADHCERSLGVKFHMGTKERERERDKQFVHEIDIFDV